MNDRARTEPAPLPGNVDGSEGYEGQDGSLPASPAISRSTIRTLVHPDLSPCQADPTSLACRHDALKQTVIAVTHDFNNVLTVMTGLLEPAVAKTDPAMQGANHEIMQKMVKQLAALSRHLQHTASHDSIQDSEEVAIVPLIREIASIYLVNSMVRIAVFGDDSLTVWMNRVQLTQIMQNLILNARQAMPHGGDLTINAVTLHSPNGANVMVVVADHGSGIDSADLPHVFDMHFTTRQDGHGIGLGFVKAVMDKIKGQISVSSRLGYGTAFTLLFPPAPTETTEEA